jgi:hypothetical protein
MVKLIDEERSKSLLAQRHPLVPVLYISEATLAAAASEGAKAGERLSKLLRDRKRPTENNRYL